MHLHQKKTTQIILSFLLALFITMGCSSSSEEITPSSPEAPASENPESEENEKSVNQDTSSEEKPVVFEEPLFLELLIKELGKEEIYPSDLVNVVNLKITADEFIFLASPGESEKSVILFNEDAFEYDGVRYEGFGTMKSLADLKYFPNLDKLFINLQPEMDYSTLPENIRATVRVVQIYQSQLEDITFLDDFKNLLHVTLNTNRITDLSPLTDKTGIETLYFNWNQVEDLSPVATLTGLKRISAYGNKISDLTPLSGLKNLEQIEFYQNMIQDITPLKEIRTLTKIELINNQIEDISPLEEFASFDELRLSGNPITNIEVLDHIDNLDYTPSY
ncbi:MAG: leucine-rich repeat domain-containing protein [Clostridia bacterium]|nr:leucine-rich repeat domain-containing protein [Clostridia bacterium]